MPVLHLRGHIKAVGVLLCVLSSDSCISTGSDTSTIFDTELSDAEVLEAALQPLAHDLPVGSVVVSRESLGVQVDEAWFRAQAGATCATCPRAAFSEMLANYAQRCRRASDLPLRPNDAHFRLVDDAELRRLFSEGGRQGWSRFRETFGGATVLVDLGLPGYARDRAWAVMVLFLSRGFTAGEERVLILHKHRTGWVVEWTGVVLAT
jgi:hypothetical protein